MTNKVWFITGAGRGLGQLIARDALKTGDKVVATSLTVDGIADSLSAPDGSLLVDMIASGDMPEDGDPMPAEELEVIKAWIAEGAENN